MLALNEIRKYIFQNYNKLMQKFYNYLVKMKTVQTMSLFQQFKLELYKIKVLDKTIEFKIEKITNGLLNLLVYRVKNLK